MRVRVRIDRSVHLIHDELGSNHLCFSKKVRFSVVFCVLIQSNYGGVVIVGCESDQCANDMAWLKCFLSCLKQWPSDLPMESYIFFSQFLKTRKTFLFENKCLFKYAQINLLSYFFKYVLIYRRNSLCFLFLF